VSGRFDGRVAIVTGAARGVGRRAAELFIEEGAVVVAGDRLVDELAEAFQEAGSCLVPVEADVRRRDQCEFLVKTAIERFERLDVLFNNAGVTLRGPVEETSDAVWEEALETNLRSVFLCCRAAIPQMRRQGSGAIVNNASINAIRGNAFLTAYSAAKGGVVALTRALATELAAAGIRVNALCPGTIDTPMTAEYLSAADDPDAAREALVRKHPLGRLATSEDVARAALFLASDDAAFITGVALPVDGGRHLI
jgi:NAD(P)-dependent dehydrogenase (short-subunit alcohol dehydrogenase family)